MIRSNLDVGISSHSENCEKAAIFSVVEHPGISNLLMTCEVACLSLSMSAVAYYVLECKDWNTFIIV